MTRTLDIAFSKSAKIKEGGTAVFLVKKGGGLPAAASDIDPQSIAERAMTIEKFSGKALSSTQVVAPAGSAADRLLIVGLGDDLTAYDWLKAGGAVAGKLKAAKTATIVLDIDGLEPTAAEVADFALGMMLRNYKFDRYKTAKSDDDDNGAAKDALSVTIVTSLASEAKKAFAVMEGIGDGVLLARDLVNEPANILGPVEFAERAKSLEKLGVEIDILTEKEMKKHGMGAFLGVGQGASRPSRLVVMRWNGSKAKDKPVAFIGKGVVFDTGGISIKPSSGMEDMKGDMAGAAAVTGLMHALAARKAKANVIGIIGLVENMPDANAQRPGDIVTSMSGQTIEIINTDAEGRLILCDMLTYCEKQFKPQFMVNLATLTGAILVALGHHHAGLFSNNDMLAERLTEAGLTTQEKLWRMPLGKEYDKLMDSKFADMKNSGGRFAGSITAAQFLQRFVKDTPWAHLDIAGTGMSSPQNEINQSWASGFGVRLLDELVRAHYES